MRVSVYFKERIDFKNCTIIFEIKKVIFISESLGASFMESGPPSYQGKH